MKFPKTIKKGDKQVIINRSLLSDGYNYYLLVIGYNSIFKTQFVDYSHKQTESILSYKKALTIAKQILYEN